MTKAHTPRTRPESALYRLSEAARLLSTSGPTLKHWIQLGRIRAVRTPGGHYRVPQSEVRRLSGVSNAEALPDGEALAAISGRNKLYGTVTKVRYGGLLAEVTISVGAQSLTAIITSASCRTLGLKAGVAAYGLVKATEVMVIRA